MISRIFVRWRWLRRKFNRTHWAARLMGIPPATVWSDKPGLILIQIDGLARTQLEKAMEDGKLPFLARLLRRRHFALETFYSGVPSTTPAVQGEIFFGVRAAVPGFQFLRRGSGKVLRMYEAASADEIERELLEQCDEPLLKDAHTYSNIYRAGAERSRYCSKDLAPDELLRRLHPLKGLLLSVAYAPRILRIAGLAVVEVGLAVIDAFRGFYERGSLRQELLFVPARVFVCLLLREAIRFRVLLDIERGTQVIHANFLGYDEQSHRRGPDSAFAHWTLKGIDRAVRDIYRAAIHSEAYDYEMIVYSDHGQEQTEPFAKRHGRGIDEALQEVFAQGPLAGAQIWMSRMPAIVGNAIDRWRSWFGQPAKSSPDASRQIVVTAMGPLGHVYVPEPLEPQAAERYARAMVEQAGVPLVLLPGPGGAVRAYNRRGVWSLPEDREELLGGDHPFLAEAAEDLARLCHHRDAGDFLISGWDPQQPPLTFPMENGAHGGPGSEETRGFLLLPSRLRRWHCSHLPGTYQRVRGEELRTIALHYLQRQEKPQPPAACHPERPLRVMTYNIHSCIGLDGRIRPERVARVINHVSPDVVAVQEIDAHRLRSGELDQAQLIAEHLQMNHVFHAMFEEEKERYGIAVFSKHPVELIKAEYLTVAEPRRMREARGAIWLKVMPEGGMPFHFFNTHFGLGRRERDVQVAKLLGDEWLGSLDESEPVILCGDLNSRAGSAVCRRLQHRLRDVQLAADGHRPRATFTSLKPFLRIDHIFVSRHFTVQQVEVLDDPSAVMASDHLPLAAELCCSPYEPG